MNRSLMAMVAATAFVAALPAYAAETAQTFVDKAAAGGLFEIQSSELALKMSKSGEIKSFAQMMVQDHGKANAALETVAKKEGLKVPVALDKEHAAKIQTLQSAGSQFDPPYVKASWRAIKRQSSFSRNMLPMATMQRFNRSPTKLCQH
jgi:putative membrane protein